jgi:hypothetical protein
MGGLLLVQPRNLQWVHSRVGEGAEHAGVQDRHVVLWGASFK